MSTPPPISPGTPADPSVGPGSAEPETGFFNWEGIWQSFFNAFDVGRQLVVSVLHDVGMALVENVLPIAVSVVVDVVIPLQIAIGRKLGEHVDEWEAESGPVFVEAAQAGLADFFNVPPPPINLSGGAKIGRGAQADLARAVFSNMFGSFSDGGELSPEDGQRNAEQLLGFSLGTAIEGWLGGILTKTVVTQFIPNFGDLDDVVSSNLGLGRASSTVLSPLINAAILTPWRWSLNQRFTPEILSESEAVKAWIQGFITDDDYFEIMSRHGVNRDLAVTLQGVRGRFYFKEDINRFLRLGMIDRTQALEMYRKRGFLPEAAELLVEMNARLGEDEARQRMITVGSDMYRDREIDDAEYQSIMGDAGAPPEEIEARLALGRLERSRPRSLPRSIAEKAHEQGLKDDGWLRAYYITAGYNDDAVGVLMAIAKNEREEFLAKEAEKAEKERGDRFKGLN